MNTIQRFFKRWIDQLIKIVLLFSGVLIFYGCPFLLSPDGKQGSEGEEIYENSFERAQDTVGISGNGGFRFSTDVPPGGGNRSLEVAGGCIYPHVVFEIGPLSRECTVKIEFWGKLLEGGGGGVNLSLDELNTTGIDVAVTDTQWHLYKPDQQIYCPENHTLQLSLNCGGIVAGSMLIDEIRIINIDL